MESGNYCPICKWYVPTSACKVEQDGDSITIAWYCECRNCYQKFVFYEWFEKRGEEIELEEN